MKAIAVFCGSRMGAKPAYARGASRLGSELARRGITLVYGGASVGIMGVLADSVLQAGGKVVGVIPTMLEEREISHRGLTELIVVGSMHERKLAMSELADGFIAMPGGPGTMEELFEIFTWGQLGLHGKPIGLLNVDGYYDGLISFFGHMNREQFLQDKYMSMALSDTDPASLLDQFASYTPPEVKTYIKKSQT
ncbi:TIGR00730 family Rossman fold protein [Paenibacillus sp. RUD330]|uniref:LOG family protein n=1 Tax=Paenibacillus sp. RUD330 TaxID=2023772 RepID=UPI000B92BABB|nr:TIGR00730 family Rossman fold protein [Paenibacillus sp. RUD330]ASS64944.1 TIGR00730 family Rossman fold protein [Paenibacillus sp. RUD330]